MYWIARRPEYTRRVSRARTGPRPAGPAPQSCAFFRVHARQFDRGGLHSLNNRMNIARASALALLLALAPGAAFAQSGAQTHSAAGGLTGAQAQTIAQKLLPIPKGYIATGTFSQSYFSPGYGQVYTVMFQKPQTSSLQGPIGSVQATVDARTGQIVQYSRYRATLQFPPAHALSQSAVDHIASTWLARLNPRHAQLTLIQSNGWGWALTNSVRYSLTFENSVHGFPVAFQSATVSLNAEGQLVGYQSDWQNAVLPAPPAYVQPQPTAEQSYIKALQLSLMYVAPFNPFAMMSGSNVLAYEPTTNAPDLSIGEAITQPVPWISASTAEALNAYGQPLAPVAPYTPFVKGGPTQLPYAHRKPLSKQQSEALAKAAVPAGCTLVNSNQSPFMKTPSGTSSLIWNFTFQLAGKPSYSVTVDPLWHTILNMNQFFYQSSSGISAPQGAGATAHARSLSSSRLTAIATAYVEKLNPQSTGALAQRPAMGFGQPGSANRSFIFLDHGIPVQNAVVQVMLDRSTGTVTGYFTGFPQTPSITPAPGKVIPLAQAQEAYAKKQPVHLEYVLPLRQNPSVSSSTYTAGKNPWTFSSQAILVYVPMPSGPSQFLNAETGQWQSFQTTDSSIPADIKGHAGEQAMLLLIRSGALAVQKGRVHPDATVTRGAFITLLVKAGNHFAMGNQQAQAFSDVSPDSPDYSAVQQAVQDGILQPGGAFHPNQPLTRNDAARWLVAYLGYQDLAGESGLFQLPFHDTSAIPANDRGDAAIASRLGLIAPQSGNWDGARPLTVAQAAVAVVAALQFQAGQTG